MKKYWQKIQRFVIDHQFLMMISGALIVAIIATGVNIWFYVSSGAINVDLSRPGYEAVRKETVDDPSMQQTFSSDGELTQQVRDDFLVQIDILQNNLKQMNDFSNDSLSDKALNLEPASE